MIGIGITLSITLSVLILMSGGSSEARSGFATIVSAAIVIPAILLTLNIVGLFIYEKSNIIPLIFGIGTAIICTVLLLLAIVRGTITIFEGINNSEYIILYIIIAGLAYTFAGMNIGGMVSGIKLSKW